jgi:regulator of protease activity HflC (stomatin/prohibitin superfamily)
LTFSLAHFDAVFHSLVLHFLNLLTVEGLGTNNGQGNVSNFAQTHPTGMPYVGLQWPYPASARRRTGRHRHPVCHAFDCRRPKPFRQPDGSIMDWTYIFGILVIVALLYLVGALRVLRQYERGVVFILGKFEGVRGPGLTLIFVPVQQMVRVSLRTVTMQIPSQKIITKDNVSIDIAAVAYYHISDPEKAVIVIENVYNAINQISQTTVRNVVGRFSLDQLLSDTASINLQIKNVIDGHTEPWGTQVTAVEIKDIVLPDNMQRAMAKEAEAERERRAKIVAAEGEYQAAVKLGQAADIITAHPVALQLRTLQTMAEISVEKNSTIIFPAQFMTTVQEAFGLMSKDSASK